MIVLRVLIIPAWTVVLTILLAGPAAANVLIDDDFDDDVLDGWVVHNTVSVSGGVVHMTGSSHRSIINQTVLPTTQPLVHDVDVRFMAAGAGGPTAYLMFSLTNTNTPFQGSNDNYYFWVGYNWGWKYELGRREGWSSTVLASGSLVPGLLTETWYHVTVSNDDGNISVSLVDPGQGELLSITYDDTGNDPDGAYMGLFTTGAGDVDYDNVRVIPDLPTVQFEQAGTSGDEAITPANLTVVLSEPVGVTVTVDYSVIGGTADGDGEDFTLVAGTLQFDPFETIETVGIDIVNDSQVEPDETILIALANPSAEITLGANDVHTYTIIDNDIPPAVQFDQTGSTGGESVTPVHVSVSLGYSYAQTVRVSYAVTGGTAIGGGVDFLLPAGTLTFDPGQTNRDIILEINDDGESEQIETIEIALSSPVNAYLGVNRRYTYVLYDNETEPTDVELILEEHNGLSRSGEMVSMGVPFAISAAAEPVDLRVEDGSGIPVPAQFNVLNRWWSPAYDDSIRWLLVTFPADVAADGSSNYYLRNGANVSPAQAVSVSQDGNAVAVDTGVIKAVIDGDDFKVLNEVWLDADSDGTYEAGEKIIDAATGDGLVVVSGDWAGQGLSAGDQFLSSTVSATLAIEESGPMRAVICVKGRLQRAALPIVDAYYAYTVRLYFYAGQATVRCHVTLHNNWLGDYVYSWPIEEFGIRGTLSLAGAMSYAFLGQGVPVRGSVGGEVVKLYQDSNGTDQWQQSSSGQSIGGVTFRGYKVYEGAGQLEQSDQARGWLDITNGSLGCAVGVKDFWQQYPKALRIDGSRIEIALMPTEWSELFCLNDGMRKRHEVVFNFHTGGLTDQQLVDVCAAADRPIMTRCESSRYVETNAWPYGAGQAPPRATASSYDKHATSGWDVGLEYGWDWFGKNSVIGSGFNSGGMHDNEGSMFLPWILWGEWRQFEAIETAALWFDLIQAVHFDDVDMPAYWEYYRHFPSAASGATTQLRYPGWYDRVTWARPDSGHCMMSPLMEYYYLTGDRHALEGQLYYGRLSQAWLYPRLTEGDFYPFGPVWTGDLDDPNFTLSQRYDTLPLWNLVQSYAGTGDADWLDYLAIRDMLAIRNSLRLSPVKYTCDQICYAGQSGGGGWTSDYDPAVRALSASQSWGVYQIGMLSKTVAQYYLETGDEDALDIVIAYGDALTTSIYVRDAQDVAIDQPYSWGDYWGIGNTSYGFTPDPLQALAWAYDLTGKPRFLGDVQSAYGSWGASTINGWAFHVGYALKALNNPRSDMTPPAAVADLCAARRADGSVIVRWTAPGDDAAVGRAWKYQLKYSTDMIVESCTGWPDWTNVPMTVQEWKDNAAAFMQTQRPFVSAVNVDGEPTPAPAGAVQSMIITGLEPDQAYTFAIKTFDRAHNISEISNVLSLTVGQDPPADLDCDGDADLDDFSLFAEVLTGPAVPAADPLADFDGDGDSDLADLALFAANFTG